MEDFSVQGVDLVPIIGPIVSAIGWRVTPASGRRGNGLRAEVKGQGKWDRSAPPGWGQVSGTWRDGRGLHRVRWGNGEVCY